VSRLALRAMSVTMLLTLPQNDEASQMSMYSLKLREVLKRLDELTNWERLPRRAMRMSLEPTLDLMQRLDDPHHAFRSVHVTGTKGKGSVCSLIEGALTKTGLVVGKYSSPHLQTIHERISIGGRLISDDQLCIALSGALEALADAKRARTAACQATWFDVFTAAAFVAFREAGVDWAIVEVGLGGRVDSTNVIHGEVAIVTNVELEHTDVLGATREEIASEKAGILKAGATLVTSLSVCDAAGEVLAAHADASGCIAVRVSLGSELTLEERNISLAGEALDQLGRLGVVALSDCANSVPVGAWLLDLDTCRQARLPGRMEHVIVKGPATKAVPMVLDGAHVPFNLEGVLRDLRRQKDTSGLCVAVVAVASDKDSRGLLSVLARHASYIVLTELPLPSLGLSCVDLCSISKLLGVASESQPDLAKAVARAVALASERGEWVLVTGSLHLVGAARNFPEIAAA
jgi:dihydrofolate synthase / folylpolyglutamate synthase